MGPGGHDGAVTGHAVHDGGGNGGDIDTVSLIDLTSNPIRAVETVSVPSSPEGVKFSPDGKFLAVASVDGSTRPSNSPFFHDHGRLWMLSIQGGLLKPIAEAPITPNAH